jgi:hypothetical protein
MVAPFADDQELRRSGDPRATACCSAGRRRRETCAAGAPVLEAKKACVLDADA